MVVGHILTKLTNFLRKVTNLKDMANNINVLHNVRRRCDTYDNYVTFIEK